jgi:glycosyltransferase involved in cell wall biosynthesis
MTPSLSNGVGPVFTVFTPTFNRKALLARVYECLCAQTFRDFEWLVIDDGSSDGTGELVQGWREEDVIEIVYQYQNNRGKHVAFNRGVALARGKLFLPLDSDDTCIPTALERFFHQWVAIPEGERAEFSGITCLCADRSGTTVGRRFPAPIVDSYPIEFIARLGGAGERWGFTRVEVLRAFPFPENAGERFVPEGLIWNRIGRVYKIRFIDEVLRVYEALPGGLSRSIVRLRASNPASACAFYLEHLQFDLPPLQRIKTLINYGRFFLHCRREGLARFANFRVSLASLVALPLAYAAYLADRVRM